MRSIASPPPFFFFLSSLQGIALPVILSETKNLYNRVRVFPPTTLLYSLFSLHNECIEFTTPPSRIRVPPPLTSGGMKRFVDYYPSVAFGDSSPHNGSR